MPLFSVLILLATLGVPSLHRSLCEAGMADVALVYIDWVSSRAFVPDELKTGRDLALATTHLAAFTSGERSARHNELAREAITRALAADPQNAEATLIAAQLRFQDASAVFASQFTESRRLFGEAAELATSAATLANAAAKAARQRGVTDADLATLFCIILQGKLLALTAAHRSAATLPENSTERTDALRAAAESAKSMARRYAMYQGGLEAKCLAAEMLYDAGDDTATRDTLAELEPLAWSDFPSVRMRALRLVLEMNRREQLWDESRSRIAEWLAKTSPTDRASREGVLCSEVAAATLAGEAETLDATDPAAANSVREKSLALLEAIPAARRTNRVQEQLTALRANAGEVASSVTPTTLDEAQRLIDQSLTTLLQIERDASSGDATKRAVTVDAIAAIHAAMRLADSGTPIETISRWRRQLARLYAMSGDSLAATIVAEVTLPAIGQNATPREVPPLLSLALQSCYAARETERSPEDAPLFVALTARLARLAEFATTHFPATPPARDAERILVVLTLEDERLDEALTRLEQIDGAAAQQLAASEAAVTAWNKFVTARDKRAESTERWLALTQQLIGRGMPAEGETLEASRDAAFVKVAAQVEALQNGEAVETSDEVERLAEAGEFGEALAVLTVRIKEHPQNLPLQQRAATLAATCGDYNLAIDGDDTIWGWRGIAVRTASDKALRETYFTACYEKWRCMLAQAATLTGEERQRCEQEARRDWERFQILRPDAGGPAWRKRYEQLFSQPPN